ncbi:hypothetical protein EMCRGX_G016654 [Ephydatia muelleri]
MWRVSVFAILLPLAFGGQFPFSATLAKDSSGLPIYELQWSFDVVQQTITFNVLVNTTGWVGFGLSRDGGMIGSDVVTGWVNSTGVYLQDRFADAQVLPPIDAHQDWLLLSGNEANGWTNLTFTRKWVTGDSRDRDVLANTARVIFSWGVLDPVTMVPQYHGPTSRGSLSLNLLGGLVNKPPLPADARNLTLTIKNVTVPALSTAYWCAGYKLPVDVFSQKRYIVQYSPVIASTANNTMHVHHILLYLCTSLNETTDLGAGFDCDRNATPALQSCFTGQVIAAWAVGGETFTYPEGISLGLGGPGQQYLMLQMHYDNPRLETNIIDSSGLNLIYTSTVPQNEAGILNLGLLTSPLLMIPPKASAFTVRGICMPNCSSSYFPPTGITIFANLLHSHLAGVGITLRHMRWNKTCGAYQELPPIDQNLQYDFNFQQFTTLPYSVTVLPGDLLEVDCIYNTASRNNLSFGGEATTDEMCLSFVTYYPRIDNFVACGSVPHPYAYADFVSNYFSQQNAITLNSLFTSFTKPDQVVRDGLSRTYGSLQWNQAQISSFQQATSDGYLIGFCFKTDRVTLTQDLLTPPSLTCTAQPVTAAALGVQWMKGGMLLMLLLAAFV